MRKRLLTIMSLLLVAGALSACGSTKTTKDMGYEESPCACLDDPIIFNGKVFERKNA